MNKNKTGRHQAASYVVTITCVTAAYLEANVGTQGGMIIAARVASGMEVSKLGEEDSYML